MKALMPVPSSCCQRRSPNRSVVHHHGLQTAGGSDAGGSEMAGGRHLSRRRLRAGRRLAQHVPRRDILGISQLIPFGTYHASDGGPVRTATDIDVFASDAFSRPMKLLEIREHREDRHRPTCALDEALEVLRRVSENRPMKLDVPYLRHDVEAHRRSACSAGLIKPTSGSGQGLPAKLEAISSSRFKRLHSTLADLFRRTPSRSSAHSSWYRNALRWKRSSSSMAAENHPALWQPECIPACPTRAI